MTSIPDHYAALGIDPTADPEVITAAYRALAKKFHPDTGAAAGTASPERFDQIQRAYEVLRDPDSRHAYDLELLAETEAALAAHLASKRRVVPHGQAAARGGDAAAADAARPPPDLGDIRPEPAVPPSSAPPRQPAGRPAGKPGRSVLPFAVPLVLVAALGAAGAWMFLPAGPEAPPLPSAAKTDSAAPAAAPSPVAEAPAPTPVVAAPPPAPQPQPSQAPAQASAPATAEKPVFGSVASDAPPPAVAAAAPPGDEGPANAAAGAVITTKPAAAPAFGSTADAAAPDAAALPPPVPKAKPAQPAPAKPAPAKPAPKKTAAAQKPAVQKQAAAPPRARLQYEDPPRYDPRDAGGYDPRYDTGYADGDYPPPGLEPPPGFEPPGYMEPDYPPPGYAPGRGPYRLVIFERRPGRPATAWSAGVVFKSMGKCTRQGVKAVLRRTGDLDPYSDTRVWYECQRLSQR